ncbi:sulfotransferase family 2 domain-containing protein [Maritimibacter sp. UBA3975]|uniref:sulfotransferase family 2 domain-containing protein n=1 Tax=Maritimibacter sp. UBA3975 TaxID=1946833 RepID=UPI000C091912|nr:sulfotransferase family 2 domain-containing protein [Maritimibacter sp. UBA3975]MAM62844.1 Type II secretory pathway, pullulanase PulA [Maritimibacter sp.]|tara:strand:+ start:4512 stop:5165 length:654 start_codon:yes stop_codon:yes gene_type:complete
MILSRGRRYIFVHAPKTGGTSLALMLEDKAMKDDIMLGDTPKARKRRGKVRGIETSGRLWKHSMLTDLYGLVTQEEMEDFFVFTLVRNPWDRMVSYYHWLGAQAFDHPAVAKAKALDFAAFVTDPMILRSMELNPYGRYVEDRDGVERGDHFIRLERFGEDLAPVETALGLKFNEIAHENASNRVRDYRKAYSKEGIEAVAQACCTDIERFGYTFDG